MKKHNTKLIEGNFSPEKAKTILMELLSRKINFHEKEKFSNELRFGEDRDHCAKRIKQLTQERQDLIQWLDTLDAKDNLKINCVISLEKE